MQKTLDLKIGNNITERSGGFSVSQCFQINTLFFLEEILPLDTSYWNTEEQIQVGKMYCSVSHSILGWTTVPLILQFGTQ